MNGLELYNPVDYDDEDDEEDGLMLIENKPKKRKKRKNPEPTYGIMSLLLMVGGGYLAWCAYNQTKYKVWNWQPWKLAGRPRLQLRRANTNNAQAEEERRRASLHEAIEQMMKPSVITVDTEMPWRRPRFKPTSEETVSFIEP